MSPSPATTWAAFADAETDAPTLPEDHDPRRAAAVLRDLANPCRFAVLCILCEGEQCVGTLGERLGLSQSALSQHLARLRRARLVVTRRDQQRIFYALATPDLAPLVRLIAGGCAQVSASTRLARRSAGGGRVALAIAAE